MHSNLALDYSWVFDVSAVQGGAGRSGIILFFSVDEDVAYRLEGGYTTGASETFSDITLYGCDGYCFDGFNEHAPGSLDIEQDYAGLPGLTGTLQAGEEYWLAITHFAGDAVGDVRLVFVPEPSTSALLALGLMFLARLGQAQARG